MTDNQTDRYLATYGTLRLGHGNYEHFLNGIATVRVQSYVLGYKMATFGGYPAIFRSDMPDDSVVVDVFDLGTADDPEATLARIDRMEFGAGYTREEAETHDGVPVYLYVMDASETPFFPEEIPTGDWNDYEDRRYG